MDGKTTREMILFSLGLMAKLLQITGLGSYYNHFLFWKYRSINKLIISITANISG